LLPHGVALSQSSEMGEIGSVQAFLRVSGATILEHTFEAGGPMSGAVAATAAGVFSPAAVECADPRDLMVAVTSMSQREIDALSAEEAEGFVLACDRLRSALDARRAVAMDTLAGRVDEDLQRRAQDKRREGVPVHPGPELHGFMASMLAPGLHCSTRAVQRRVEADRRLVCFTESTHQALWDGDLDLPRADAVAEAARSVDPVTGEITLVSEAGAADDSVRVRAPGRADRPHPRPGQ
jgi:hypothetical protein